MEFLLHFLAFLEFLSGSGSKVQGAQLPAAAGQPQQSAGIRGRGRLIGISEVTGNDEIKGEPWGTPEIT